MLWCAFAPVRRELGQLAQFRAEVAAALRKLDD